MLNTKQRDSVWATQGANMELNAWAEFIQEIDKLKAVERKTLAQNRYENSAEHSWHLAMAVLSFQRCFGGKNFDLGKALEMALLHDVVEIDAGDTFIYADQSKKQEEEKRAAKRIFGILPQAIGADLKSTWEHFEEKNTPEAKLVAALDRFLPLYSNHLNQGHSWKKHGVKLAQVIEKNKAPIEAASPELWAYAEVLLKKSVANGDLSV
jgi:putative hydrolase of HD superfamily